MIKYVAYIFGYKQEIDPWCNQPFYIFLKKGRYIVRSNGFVEYWKKGNWRVSSLSLIGFNKKLLIKYENPTFHHKIDILPIKKSNK